MLAQIAREEEKLAALAEEIEKGRQRVATLKDELGRPRPETPETRNVEESKGPAPILSSLEKVRLFRSLFRGREDLFARRWENLKTGRSGYAPACENEWVAGVCAKIRSGGNRKAGNVCGECKNQRFLPVTEEQIARHLKGLQVMGVYPLLLDETCWFLAADFDGDAWLEDVEAFAKTCTANGLTASVERSRSGHGAHVWFFFSEPVPATMARKMGCFLITETMARRHQLPMQSYDRFFPNQDTLPKGGFGNLIALPLQREARLQGNAVFVDHRFLPLPDQWAHLTAVHRIGKSLVQAIAQEAAHSGRILGLKIGIESTDEEHDPTYAPIEKARRRASIPGPLPQRVLIQVTNRLHIGKEGLPSPLLDQIKRLAAFQNPEFYKKQSMRLSTALTPRVLRCFEESPSAIALPRGCLPDLEALLHDHGISLALDDGREAGALLDVTFKGRLTSEQEQAVHALLRHEMGILVAPPGSGKTVAGVSLIAARGRSTLILVHRKPLLEQWISQLALFLGIAPKEVGQIGAGKRKPNGLLDVAMIQSLVRKGQVDELVGRYGHVLVDECHHVSAVSFERVLFEARARFLTGLTATPRRRDGHEPIIHMQLGPVRHAVSQRPGTTEVLGHRLVICETGFDQMNIPEGASIQEIYALLSKDPDRNDLIFDDVIAALEAGRSPIVLTERRDHLEHFAERLRRFTKHLVILHGGMKAGERKEALSRCAEVPVGEERVLLATGRFLGEGFDDARLDTLFLTLPVSWKGTLVQYTGRLHRSHSGKTEVRVYDYLDEKVPMLRRMFERRLRGYRAIGYELGAAVPAPGHSQPGMAVIGEGEGGTRHESD
ncbi:MAG: DEAD/DEAH box helicase family protein [Acidobacteriota bacterium]